MVARDFNATLYLSEKLGGNPNLLGAMAGLANFVQTNELMDIDLRGKKFTWSNKQIEMAAI